MQPGEILAWRLEFIPWRIEKFEPSRGWYTERDEITVLRKQILRYLAILFCRLLISQKRKTAIRFCRDCHADKFEQRRSFIYKQFNSFIKKLLGFFFIVKKGVYSSKIFKRERIKPESWFFYGRITFIDNTSVTALILVIDCFLDWCIILIWTSSPTNCWFKPKKRQGNMCWDFASKTNNVFAPIAVHEYFGTWTMVAAAVNAAKWLVTT